MSRRPMEPRFVCKRGAFKGMDEPIHSYCHGCKHLVKEVRCENFEEKEAE